MLTFLIVIQVLIALAMIGLILVQRGSGAAAGASFGAGASSTVFGSRGAASFLTRSTSVLATAFFLVSFIMAMIIGRTLTPETGEDLGVMSDVPVASQPAESESDLPASEKAPADSKDKKDQ